MTWIKNRLAELSKLKMSMSYEQAETEAAKFSKKMCTKIEKKEHVTIPEEQRKELKEFVYWQFIDEGATWFLKKEPITKFSAFLDQWQPTRTEVK